MIYFLMASDDVAIDVCTTGENLLKEEKSIEKICCRISRMRLSLGEESGKYFVNVIQFN